MPVTIANKALSGSNEFAIRLDPPELGRIDVQLKVDKDGRITSHLIADRKDTLDLLQRDASGLQRALQDAGLKTSDSGLQFSLRDQSADTNSQQQSGGQQRGQVLVKDDTGTVSEVTPAAYSRYISQSGGVDIRV